jgi:hypothetical protein
METLKHEFSLCYAVEIPRYVYVPEHDDFIDSLPALLGEIALKADDEA